MTSLSSRRSIRPVNSTHDDSPASTSRRTTDGRDEPGQPYERTPVAAFDTVDHEGSVRAERAGYGHKAGATTAASALEIFRASERGAAAAASMASKRTLVHRLSRDSSASSDTSWDGGGASSRPSTLSGSDDWEGEEDGTPAQRSAFDRIEAGCKATGSYASTSGVTLAPMEDGKTRNEGVPLEHGVLGRSESGTSDLSRGRMVSQVEEPESATGTELRASLSHRQAHQQHNGSNDADTLDLGPGPVCESFKGGARLDREHATLPAAWLSAGPVCEAYSAAPQRADQRLDQLMRSNHQAVIRDQERRSSGGGLSRIAGNALGGGEGSVSRSQPSPLSPLGGKIGSSDMTPSKSAGSRKSPDLVRSTVARCTCYSDMSETVFP